MRNVFDQYTQPENRLTHALAVCLNEDRELLRDFLEWLGVRPPCAPSELVVLEQRLPGDSPEYVPEKMVERQGLPDIVIHDSGCWSLLVESKIQARLTTDQLDRHEKTIRRRGYGDVHRLTLTKGTASRHGDVIDRSWSGLYEWLGSHQGSSWANKLRLYLRIAEGRLSRDRYLTEGTLTMFDGFQFSHSEPYTYGEAKRLLKLVMAELRHSPRLREMGVNIEAPGRKQITGSESTSVWDFLWLDGFSEGGQVQQAHPSHTQNPTRRG